MAVALDSNAVIGFLDRDDAFHPAAGQRIRELLEAGETLFASAITYTEALTGAKLGHHDEQVVRGFFKELIGWVMPVEATVAERAAELRAEAKALKLPDALILAAADLEAEVELLICSDDVAGQLARSLSCRVEPLTAGP